MYDKDYTYAATRLDGTYASLMNGTPIHIVHVSASGKVEYQDLDEGAISVCHLDAINCCPLTLGYANTAGGAVYLSRIPSRRYRQGLTQQNVSMRLMGNSMRIQFSSDILRDCVKGNYLSLQDIFKIIEGKQDKINPFELPKLKSKSWAWSRKWALQSGGKVEYKGRIVGECKNRVIELYSKFRYLKEELEESL